MVIRLVAAQLLAVLTAVAGRMEYEPDRVYSDLTRPLEADYSWTRLLQFGRDAEEGGESGTSVLGELDAASLRDLWQLVSGPHDRGFLFTGYIAPDSGPRQLMVLSASLFAASDGAGTWLQSDGAGTESPESGTALCGLTGVLLLFWFRRYITFSNREVYPKYLGRYCATAGRLSKLKAMRFTRRNVNSRLAVAILSAGAVFAAPASAGTIDAMGDDAPGAPFTPSPDYSWTQLLSPEDPQSLESLMQLLNGGGAGLFLMTGNTSYNYNGWPGVLVIGANSGFGTPSGVADETSIPEPGTLALVGIGFALLGLGVRHGPGRKTTIEIQKLRRS